MPELNADGDRVHHVPLTSLLQVFRDGDERGWAAESFRLWRKQPMYMMQLLRRIRQEGIREPILLGTDGRVWDGHHRLAVARVLRLTTVPVVFAGDHHA